MSYSFLLFKLQRFSPCPNITYLVMSIPINIFLRSISWALLTSEGGASIISSYNLMNFFHLWKKKKSNNYNLKSPNQSWAENMVRWDCSNLIFVVRNSPEFCKYFLLFVVRHALTQIYNISWLNAWVNWLFLFFCMVYFIILFI